MSKRWWNDGHDWTVKTWPDTTADRTIDGILLLRKQTVTYDLSTAGDECILQVATGHSICTVWLMFKLLCVIFFGGGVM